MALKYQKWNRLLELFFEYPDRRFTIREIAKRTKLPSSSVQRYVQELQEQNLVKNDKSANINSYFKMRKAFFLINKLFQTGLIEYLEKALTPSTIIIFGSARKGEYDHESDIDLFIETTKKVHVELGAFEKKLGHAIQLFIEKDINALPQNLLNNVLNGIKLTGYYTLKQK